MCNRIVTICYKNVTSAVTILEYGILKNRKKGFAEGKITCYKRTFRFAVTCYKIVTLHESIRRKQKIYMEKHMEKKKTIQNIRRKSNVRSVPKSLDKDLCEIGKGDWKKGMYESVEAWKIMHRNPEMKLMNDVEVLMSDLRLYYPGNHYEHFDNFPAVFRMFLKNGVPDFSIMKSKRFEKSLKEFESNER